MPMVYIPGVGYQEIYGGPTRGAEAIMQQRSAGPVATGPGEGGLYGKSLDNPEYVNMTGERTGPPIRPSRFTNPNITDRQRKWNNIAGQAPLKPLGQTGYVGPTVENRADFGPSNPTPYVPGPSNPFPDTPPGPTPPQDPRGLGRRVPGGYPRGGLMGTTSGRVRGAAPAGIMPHTPRSDIPGQSRKWSEAFPDMDLNLDFFQRFIPWAD